LQNNAKFNFPTFDSKGSFEDAESAMVVSLEVASAATGSEFSGAKIRSFSDFLFRGSPRRRIPAAQRFEAVSRPAATARPDAACDKWGVMTTISSPPTEAVRRFFYKRDWCIVVVADLNKPKVKLNNK
jgi:hypothetical protein